MFLVRLKKAAGRNTKPFAAALATDKKISGRILGDRGECARCRNGDLIYKTK